MVVKSLILQLEQTVCVILFVEACLWAPKKSMFVMYKQLCVNKVRVHWSLAQSFIQFNVEINSCAPVETDAYAETLVIQKDKSHTDTAIAY